MNTYTAADIHGRRTIAGASEIVSTSRVKAIRESTALAPKVKNSYTDPFTYYHIVDELLNLVPGQLFKAKEFADHLADRPLVWDAITVGRVINDVNESVTMANGRPAIDTARWWDGMRYATRSDIETRAAMENLLDDLRELCLTGEADQFSPLRRCSSLG